MIESPQKRRSPLISKQFLIPTSQNGITPIIPNKTIKKTPQNDNEDKNNNEKKLSLNKVTPKNRKNLKKFFNVVPSKSPTPDSLGNLIQKERIL